MMNNSILHWSYRDFREFPEELLEFSQCCEEIYLKENFIPNIPKWLLEFENLKFLHLCGNQLESIPNEIYQLENLEFFDVSKNKLVSLPVTLKFMKKLKRFNISENSISVLRNEIGDMESLECLNLNKNSIKRIPIEIAKCYKLSEIYANDNLLIDVPNKITMLPHLRAFEAERCNLEYLPCILSRTLKHLRIFNNTRLTHYPVIFEKYLRLHYDYWSEIVVSADLLMVFLPDECKRTVLPRGMNTIHTGHSRDPFSLFELALRHLYKNRTYYNIVCNSLKPGIIPHHIYTSIINGPTMLCGREKCARTLFTESYFFLLKKNKTPSNIIFSNMFCSKDCGDHWLEKHQNIYHCIKFATSLS